MVDVSEILKKNRKETDTWMQNTPYALFVLSVNKPIVSRVPLLVYKATRGNDPSLMSISHSDRWSSLPIDNDKDDHFEIFISAEAGLLSWLSIPAGDACWSTTSRCQY